MPPVLCWAVLLIMSGIYLHAIDPLPAGASGLRKLWKGFGVIALLLGAALLVGGLSGARDLLQPLSGLQMRTGAEKTQETSFIRVASIAELERAVAYAGKPVMLDFYADWCVACKEMERLTFRDESVKKRLGAMLLLQADVTANSAADAALLKRFGLFGPPGVIFSIGAARKSKAPVSSAIAQSSVSSRLWMRSTTCDRQGDRPSTGKCRENGIAAR